MSIIDRLFNRKKELNSSMDDMEKENLKSQEDMVEEKDIDDPREEEEKVYEILEREIHPEKIICPDCGGITLEGFEFCDKCGGEIL